MPHARHGGNGVCAFAVAGSKFVGTGFENEHIGQIQVAVVIGGAGEGAKGRAGLPYRRGGVEVGLNLELPPTAWIGPRGVREAPFEGFGYRVILGEDFRKRAWIHYEHVRPCSSVPLMISHRCPTSQHPSGPEPRYTFSALRCPRSRLDGRSSTRGHSGNSATCTSYTGICYQRLV